MGYVGDKKEGDVLCNNCIYSPLWKHYDFNWQLNNVDIEKYGKCRFDERDIIVAGEDCWERTFPHKSCKIESCCAKIVDKRR